MRLEILHCPECDRITIQGKAKVPQWKHSNGSQSILEKDVTVCSVCSFYIERRRIWQEKAYNPTNYSIE